MIYLIGGAPRTGKSILSQRVSVKMKSGWISTDLLEELLRVSKAEGAKYEWGASPAAIEAAAEWFFPYLERFTWGIASLADNYVIEGVDFMPEQVARLSTQYQIRALFLGCSSITLEQLDQFPGRSRGYSFLPEAMKRQIVQDVPLWSKFIRKEAERFSYPYIDTSGDFPSRLEEAEKILIARSSG